MKQTSEQSTIWNSYCHQIRFVCARSALPKVGTFDVSLPVSNIKKRLLFSCIILTRSYYYRGLKTWFKLVNKSMLICKMGTLRQRQAPLSSKTHKVGQRQGAQWHGVPALRVSRSPSPIKVGAWALSYALPPLSNTSKDSENSHHIGYELSSQFHKSLIFCVYLGCYRTHMERSD